MIALKIGTIAVFGVVTLLLLKNRGSAFTGVLEIALICVILFSTFPQVKEILGVLNSISLSENLNLDLIKLLFKVFFVTIVGSFVGDICRDNGESALGNVVEMSVKAISLSMALPVFKAVISVAQMFLNR